MWHGYRAAARDHLVLVFVAIVVLGAIPERVQADRALRGDQGETHDGATVSPSNATARTGQASNPSTIRGSMMTWKRVDRSLSRFVSDSTMATSFVKRISWTGWSSLPRTSKPVASVPMQ